MQILRCFLVASAAAGVTTLAVRGNDNPAQMKAREALEQKLRESPTQPAPTTQPPTQPEPAPPATQGANSEAIAKAREALHEKLQEAPPASTRAPVPQPRVAAPAPRAMSSASDAPVPPQAPAVQQADPASISKAREALHEKLLETTAPPPAATPPPRAQNPAPVAKSPAPAPMSTPPPMATAPFAPAPAVEPADSGVIAKARDAVRQTIAEDSQVGPKADSQAIAKARDAVRRRTESMNFAEPTSLAGNSPATNFPPLEGPPLPISSQKQQRLYELLQRYKADQVSPGEYQAERAKILAEP